MSHFSIYFKASLTQNVNKHFNLKEDTIHELPLSQAGKLLRWHISVLPKEICNILQKPRVVVVALTILAMLAVQFTFYPAATALAFKSTLTWLSTWVTFNQIHFSLYLASMSYALGTGLLAFGRLSQPQVLNEIQKHIEAQAVAC